MAHAGAYIDLGAGQCLEDPLLPRTQAPFVLWSCLGTGGSAAQVAELLGKDRVMGFQHGRFNSLCLIAQPLC